MARYQRASAESATAAAVKVATADGTARYVFATVNGFAVALAPPAFNAPYYEVSPAGEVALLERNLRTGEWTRNARAA